MSFFDDLDNSNKRDEFLYRKAVIDLTNAEYPAIQDWLNTGYNQGIGAVNTAAQNQINTLSMVPDMSYWTLANAYNLAQQGLMGAPGSAYTGPAFGYPGPGYGSFLGGPAPVYQQPVFAPPAMQQPALAPPPTAATQPLQLPPAPAATVPSGTAPTPVPQPAGAALPVDTGIPAQQSALTTPPANTPPVSDAPRMAGDPAYNTAPAQTSSNSYAQRQEDMRIRDALMDIFRVNDPDNARSYDFTSPTAAQLAEIDPTLSSLGIDAYDPRAQAVLRQLRDRNPYKMEDRIRASNPDFYNADRNFTSVPLMGERYNETYVSEGEPNPQKQLDLQADRFYELMTAGQNPGQIADQFGVSPMDVINTIQRRNGGAIGGEAVAPGTNTVAATQSAPVAASAGLGGTVPPQMRDISTAQLSSLEMPTASPAATATPTAAAPTAPQDLQTLINNYIANPTPDGEAAVAAAVRANPITAAELSAMTNGAYGLPEARQWLQNQGIPLTGDYIPGTNSIPTTASPTAVGGSPISDLINNYIANPTPQGEQAVYNAAIQANLSPSELASLTNGYYSPAEAQQWLQQMSGAGPVTGTTQTIQGDAQRPWQGPMGFQGAPAGTGLMGSSDTLNATLNSANYNLANAGVAGVGAIGSGAMMGRGDLMNLTQAGLGGLMPYQQGGNLATQQMAALTGLGGYDRQSAAIQNVMNSPEFQFYQDQGNQGVLRASAALGGLGGGNVMKELSRFNQGLASTQFQNYYNRLQPLAQQGLQAAGVGANLLGASGRTAANLGLGMGTAQGGLIADTGRLQAANTMGVGAQLAGNQMGVGQNLANMAFQGGNLMANQYPGLATTAAQAYGNQGAQLANLYSGLGNALAGNAYNRWNLQGGFGAYSQPVVNPGIMGQVGNVLSGVGNLATGFGWGEP